VDPLYPNDPARQAARSLSERLGILAATSPAGRREAPDLQLDAPPSAVTPRLSGILSQLRRRRQRQELVADKLRANEFMTGP
jgi:hypothetical protein